MPHQIIWSWYYTGRWWVGRYIWYSEEETGRGPSPPRPLLAVPNVTVHPSTASVPITALLYNCPLLCGFNVGIKGLTWHRMLCYYSVNVIVRSVILSLILWFIRSVREYDNSRTLWWTLTKHSLEMIKFWCWFRSGCGSIVSFSNSWEIGIFIYDILSLTRGRHCNGHMR